MFSTSQDELVTQLLRFCNTKSLTFMRLLWNASLSAGRETDARWQPWNQMTLIVFHFCGKCNVYIHDQENRLFMRPSAPWGNVDEFLPREPCSNLFRPPCHHAHSCLRCPTDCPSPQRKNELFPFGFWRLFYSNANLGQRSSKKDRSLLLFCFYSFSPNKVIYFWSLTA